MPRRSIFPRTDYPSRHDDGKTRILALLRSNQVAPNWREAVDRGVPIETPYGLHLAEQHGFAIVFSRPSRPRLFSRIGQIALGFDLFHVLRNWDLIRSADVIWTMTETEYLGVLFVTRALRADVPKIVSQTIWLFNNWNGLSKPRQYFYRRLLSHAPIMTVHSQKYVDFAQKEFPSLNVRLMKFGVSMDVIPSIMMEEKNKSTKIRILAVGGDPSRDWKTFFEAFGR